MCAAQIGHASCVEVWLCWAADINKAATGGWTALMCAARMGYASCVEVVLRGGAAVQEANREGTTALMQAAAWSGNLLCLETLIRSGAPVSAAVHGGYTALTYAASGGHHSYVEALIPGGASVHAADHGGGTALMYAATGGKLSCVSALLSRGADVHAVSRALRLASGYGHEQVATVLLAAEAAGQERAGEQYVPPQLSCRGLPSSSRSGSSTRGSKRVSRPPGSQQKPRRRCASSAWSGPVPWVCCTAALCTRCCAASALLSMRPGVWAPARCAASQ